jgi:hypothetical protein
VRILTELASTLSQPASWTKLLVLCVELCEPEPHEGAIAAPHAAPGQSADATATTRFSDDVEEMDNFDGAVGGGGVGGIGGGEEYSAAFSRLTFAVQKGRSVFPQIPDPKRWLVDALARVGGRYPGRISPMIDASPVAATVRKYAAAAGVGLP